ncbi:flagellar biosynthesis regulator FlaF [Temperatibacter marinus]|uniref:Flagellar biosynthesis regulator FlaF n=1 Tax=Temperatibacter marinus TaxID=1456591 RepID=A0AA52H967_9PROT|nr:flagellar biosynthesis regulator FlaF [Temperatibacter marinus]WND02574.1 flagellar biosynthesis regulator FlaF [Temperatibacter marinus]
MSYNAYQKAQQSTETHAEVEYRLFATVTRALISVEEKERYDPEFVKALDWNRRMWSTLSSDCGTEGNNLPKELRASIISLAIWVSKHSSHVARGSESITDLIAINKTIMEGLQLQIQNSKPTKAATPTNSGYQTSQSPQSQNQTASAQPPTFKSTSI